MIEDGIILIDKPENMTSFGVVARVRRMLSSYFERKMKVGHTGTLDPFASGLMIIVVGKECKNAQTYTKLDKTYEADIILGQTSSTGDPEGEIIHTSNDIPDKQMINDALQRFLGNIQQIPPVYSAIKVGGERAYKLARKGKIVDMPAREVKISSIELIEYTYPHLKIRTRVSSGTYIRTLAEDIGKALGVGAYCKKLRRTSIDTWSIEEAETLDAWLNENNMSNKHQG